MYIPQKEVAGIFRKTTTDVLEHIQKRIKEKKPVFLSSVTPMFHETVQVAFLLNEMYAIGAEKDKTTTYKSFFCNSGLEALHGAIKLSRHVSSIGRPQAKGRILIYDPSDEMSFHFDPLKQGEEYSLVPSIFFKNDISEFGSEIVTENNWSGVVLSVCSDISPAHIDEILVKSSNNQIVSVIDFSQTDLTTAQFILKSLSRKPDILVWGEDLTGYQIPFGAFSIIEKKFPWDNLDTCMLHSTTYGGNAVALSFIKEVLLKSMEGTLTDAQKAKIKYYEKSHSNKVEGFKKYINRCSPVLYHAGKLDIDIKESHGIMLKVKTVQGNVEEILDCVGGSGCNLRGHNQQDIIPEVLLKHDKEIDYWRALSLKLKEITAFERSFPGVSGASAVEIALTLAMAGNKNKRKILVFRGNYAGTSLVAINASDRYNVPFYPLYPDVNYINVFEPGVKQKILSLLNEETVALVWFEAIQGGSLFSIPYEILRLLKEYKEEKGYFIGMDEILNGTFRSGNFFSFDNTVLTPDVVTLSKGISDMVFPISVALTSESFYQKAVLNQPDLVYKLEKMYINQLGSHIALHGLEKVIAQRLPDNVKKISRLLRTGLKNTIRESRLLKSVDGPGLHFQLNLDLEQFPFNYLGKQWSEIAMTRLCYTDGKVLTFFGRLLPPLNITESEADQVLRGIHKAFKKSKMQILIIGLVQKWKVFLLGRTSAIARSMENI